MPENQTKLNLNWSAVEKALAEGTYSGYKIGIIETEKLFADFLRQKNIPGRTEDIKIKYLVNFLSRYEQLKYARNIYKKIIDQPHFEISHDETKQVVAGYWQACLDIEEAISSLTFFQKINLRLKYVLRLVTRKIAIFAAAFIAVVSIILFLAETNYGKKATLAISKTAHYLFFNIGPWILGAFLAIFLLWLGMKILKKKKEF